MEALKLRDQCDLTFDDENWYIFNHRNFKLIIIKRNIYNDKILNELIPGKVYNLTRESSSEENIDIENKVINELYKLGIVEFTDILVDKRFFQNRVRELEVSKRYGLALSYLKKINSNIKASLYLEMIQNTSIAIIGCGAIGSYMAVLLAALGVGELTLIDGDVIEESNLIRQVFFTENDIGRLKVNVLAEYLKRFNSNTNVKKVKDYIHDGNVLKILSGFDLIIQTADKPRIEIDRIVNKGSMVKGIPAIYVHNYSVGPLVIPKETSCFECLISMVNNKSKGKFQNFINTLDLYETSQYPAIPHGPLQITDYLYDEVLSFITKSKKCVSINNILTFEKGVKETRPIFKSDNCSYCGKK